MAAQPEQACGLPIGQFRPAVEFIPPGYRELWLRMSTANTSEVSDSDQVGAAPQKEGPHE